VSGTIVELEVTSWRLSGAMHYYGSIVVGGDWYQIDHILDKKRARDLNGQERDIVGCNIGPLPQYKAGDSTTRFDSVEDIIAELPKYIERNNLNITEVHYWDRDMEKIVWSI
jgi:hypothetical protein